MVAWGDGHYVPYSEFKLSGTNVTFSHSWSEGGDYTIIAKAKDHYGAKSPQSSFKLSITKNRAMNTPFLNFLNTHLNLFPILRILLQRLGLQ
jgi:hypothetical protein